MKNLLLHPIRNTLLCILCFALLSAAHAQEPINPAPPYIELLLAVSINRQDTHGIAVFLQSSRGDLLVSSQNLQTWHLPSPDGSSIIFNGDAYYLLKNFPQVNYQFDPKQMRINIDLPANLLNFNQFNNAPHPLIIPPPPPYGGFLNYDINGQTVIDNSQASGFFEAGLFNPAGVLISDFIAQSSVDNGIYDSQFTRLNTTWRVDLPRVMQTLQIGDSYNASGIWGRSVDFGGIQWSRNFSTQPNFITFPLPRVQGEAVLPSVVDLYVNNSLNTNIAVPPGPFAITDIPTITGQGVINMVTTDLLGRQRIVSFPYYTAPQLLVPGLHDFSYAAGFIRENFGTNNYDYGRFMITATDRFGVTPNFTSEWRSELLLNQQTIGVGGSYLLSTFGVFTLAAAGSLKSSSELGGLAQFGFQRQTIRGINFGFNTQVTTDEFTQIGLQDRSTVPTITNQVFLGIPFFRKDSLAISYTQQNLGTDSNIELVNATYTTFFGPWSLTLNGITSLSGEKQRGFFLTLTRAINDFTTLNAGALTQTNSTQGFVQLTRNLASGPSYGYNLLAAPGDPQQYVASVSAQNDFGTYQAEVSRQQNQTQYQLGVQGSIVTLDHQMYLTRQVFDSFAVAELPGYPGIDIYENNQWIGKTNRYGDLLVPNVLSYQNNILTFRQDELPLNAEFQTSIMSVIPYYHTGVVARFPVYPARAAIIHLQLDSGKSVPAGAMINMPGKSAPFLVGLEGMTYLSGLAATQTLTAVWGDNHCQFKVDYPQTQEPQPNLGAILCH